MKIPGGGRKLFSPSYLSVYTLSPVTQRPTPNKQLTMGFKSDKKKTKLEKLPRLDKREMKNCRCYYILLLLLKTEQRFQLKFNEKG